MVRAPQSRCRAFTRVDLAVVVVVTLMVVGLLQCKAASVRESAARSVCEDNLHNIVDAIHNYASGHGENFPPMCSYNGDADVGWCNFWGNLYPDLEQNAAYRRAVGKGAIWAADNHRALVKVLVCPSSDGGVCTTGAKNWAGTSYAPLAPLFGQISQVDRTGMHLTKAKHSNLTLTSAKGNSNQVGIVERFTSFAKFGWSNATLYPMGQAHWGMNPYGSAYGAWGLFPPQVGMSAANAHPYYPNSAHSVCNIVMMDGSVLRVSGKASEKSWAIACNPDSVDVLPGKWAEE